MAGELEVVGVGVLGPPEGVGIGVAVVVDEGVEMGTWPDDEPPQLASAKVKMTKPAARLRSAISERCDVFMPLLHCLKTAIGFVGTGSRLAY